MHPRFLMHWVFLFIHDKIFSNSLCDFSLDVLDLFMSALLSSSCLEIVQIIFPLLISDLILFWSENILCMISVP